MLKNNRRYCNRQVLHFRRWSRRVYSLFACVGKEAVISQLKNCVAVSSLCKSHASLVLELRFLAQRFGLLVEMDESADEDDSPNARLLALLNPVVSSCDPCAAFKCLSNKRTMEFISMVLIWGADVDKISVPLFLSPKLRLKK
ncbi:MAG TPA: hypothetical protein PKW49_02410 [Paludibacteraceae bacterium]|jgi:hypothetical protein|nr:hypothetical protein [Paludibacteraceae bacterium]HQF49485.1 hypothetical protein [Paludibacteraceae bacterium]